MTFHEVTKLVLDYGADPRNLWLQNPKHKSATPIKPVLNDMPEDDYAAFFEDFNDWVRSDDHLPNVVMSPSELRDCDTWSSMAAYIFNLQV